MPLTTYNNLLNFIDSYRSLIDELCEFITYPNISNTRRSSLLDIINKFKTFDAVDLALFKYQIQPYIDEYCKIIKIVIKTTSKGLSEEYEAIVRRKHELSNTIKTRVDEFILNHIDILDSLYVSKNVTELTVCLECLMDNCLDNDNNCIYCGFEFDDELPDISVITDVSETKRPVTKSKPNKDKEIYSKLQELQCKINPNIPSKAFDFIRSSLDEQKIKDKDVNTVTIRSILKNSPYKKYYKYDKFLVKSMTGKNYYDFTKEQEDDILNDFNVIYDSVVKLDIKMPNYNYIIYNILRKRSITCDPDDFALVKTSEVRSYQEELMRTIFKDIGWKYYTFF